MSGNLKQIRIALVSIMLFFAASLSAQTVKGTVIDNTGEPVIGASVFEQGVQSNGVATDIDGNFTLTLKGNSKKLKISYIGMKTQIVNVAGKSTVSVKLEDESNSLNDVVVIGYGTARKKDLTGSVATVKGDDLTKAPVTNAAEALTGKLPGVQITTTDGSPDAEMIIKVRGGGSITGDNSPLYIVDGFPVSTIGDIAPSDIEDITVLKDAASTAIYGSQGANGVILVTTKGAKSGKTVVSYNGFIQGKSIAKTLDTMTPYQYVMYNYERAALRGTSDISSFEKRFGSFGDLDLYQYQKGHDWQDEMFGNHELSQSHNISVSGGSEKTKFNLSGTYTTDNSLMKTNGYDRFNVNFKLNHEICKNLKLDFGMRLADVTTKGVGTGGGTYKIRSYETITKGPVNGLYDQLDIDPSTLPDDEYDEYIAITRSLQDKVNDYWRRKNERRYNYNGAITWKFLKNFTYRAEAGYDYAFFQHILKSLKKDTGRCAILFPHGVLFRNEEKDMREKLVRGDYVECVIGLAANLFYNSPMEACIVICRMNKPKDHVGKILFINAVNEVTRKNAQSYLEDKHIEKIADAYLNYKEEDNFSKVVTVREISDNDFSLSIPLYVKPEASEGEEDNRSFESVYESWDGKTRRAFHYYQALNEMIQKGAAKDE